MAKSDTPPETPDIEPEATEAPSEPLYARATAALRAAVSKYLRVGAAKLTAAADGLTSLASRVEGESAAEEPAAEAEPAAA